ncbi:hypothetical protein OnM2_077031 [Erysiphe neolycopersici]|uniref:Uncharacterized protein n=1 Tax=Erysiphe neolycopersici TaxID=212602 RepID=A0A420HHS4_9PEZI|nr:hypothetical protein OnM2_077031 [Erysiphe neolycopersici]
MLTQFRKIRSYVLASSVAAITIVGTISGSMLKTSSHAKEESEKSNLASPSETQHALEYQRMALVRKEIAITKKLKDLEARIAKSSGKGNSGESGDRS